MNCRILNKFLSFSVMLLFIFIVSCGKTGGNDDGTGGGGNPDDPKNLDYKKIIKFDTSSQSADAIKMQSFDLNSKQVGSIPIELDLTTIKSYKGDYKVGVTFLDKGHLSTKELNALKFGFNDLGGPSTVVLNNEDDANKRKAILYFSPNSLAKMSTNASGYAVFSVIFNVSYKNGSQIEQANCKANIIVTRRYVTIQKSQINNGNIDVISRSKIKEGSPVTIKVLYYSDVPTLKLKDGLFETADYQVEFDKKSSEDDAEIVTKELHFKKDETASSAISSDLLYKPKWRDLVNQASFVFKDLNTGDYAKSLSSAIVKYKFFRCDESGEKQLYFIDGLEDTNYNQTFNVYFDDSAQKAPVMQFIVCGKDVGSSVGKYRYQLSDITAGGGDYLTFMMNQADHGSKAIDKFFENTDNYISDQSVLGYISLRPDIKPEEYNKLSNLTAQLSYDLGEVSIKRTISLSAPDSVARIQWSEKQESEIAISLDSTDPLVGVETKVIWTKKAPQYKVAEVKFRGIKDFFCFVENDSDSCNRDKPDLVVKVKKETTRDDEVSTVKVKIKPQATIKATDLVFEGLLKDDSVSPSEFYPSIKDPDDKKKVSLTITSANANFFPCKHRIDGTCIDSGSVGYTPDSNIFKVLKGNKKHFIIEISSSKDIGKNNGGTCDTKESPPLGDFYLRPFMYSVDPADYNDPSKGVIVPIKDPRFKIYKLSTGLDNTKSGADTSDSDLKNGRKIIGSSVCFQGNDSSKSFCQTIKSGKDGDCRQFFLVEDNRTNGRACAAANAGSSCITVIGVSNINSDQGVLSKYPARSWRYIEIDKVKEHNPNIKFTGLKGVEDRGWGKCNMQAIANSKVVFDANNAIKILRAGQKVKDKLVVASNMTIYGAQNQYCSLGVIPYSSNTVLCNYPRLKYGDNLSVLDNDFQDLNFRFTGFDQDWNNSDKVIEIENYSAQLGYLNDKYDEKGAVTSYIDDYLQRSTFTFSLRLPVGDPSEDKCGAKEFSYDQCKSYPVETNPNPYNWDGGSSLYGRYNKNICADYLPDLIVDVKEFKYNTYEATKRYDNNGGTPNKDALVLTNLCSITGDDGTKSSCDFSHPDHSMADIWKELLNSYFWPGTCVVNKKDAKNPSFDCTIDKIL